MNRVIGADQLEKAEYPGCDQASIRTLLDRPLTHLHDQVRLLKVVLLTALSPALADINSSQNLVKWSTSASLQHTEQLKRGLEHAESILGRVSIAVRKAETDRIVKQLKNRVLDWKGFNTDDVGQIYLHDTLLVVKSGISKEQEVFLFQRGLLTFREEKLASLRSKSLSRQPALAMKGRIFVGNISTTAKSTDMPDGTPLTLDLDETRTHATSSSSSGAIFGIEYSEEYPYQLMIYYRANVNLETHCTALCFRTETSMNVWNKEILSLKRKWKEKSFKTPAHHRRMSMPTLIPNVPADISDAKSKPTGSRLAVTPSRPRGRSDAGAKTIMLRLLCSEETFELTIKVPVDISYEALQETIRRKLRNCAVPHAADGPLIILRKWEDDRVEPILSIEDLTLEHIAGKDDAAEASTITLFVE